MHRTSDNDDYSGYITAFQTYLYHLSASEITVLSHTVPQPRKIAAAQPLHAMSAYFCCHGRAKPVPSPVI